MPSFTLTPEMRAKYAAHIAACQRHEITPTPAAEFFADLMQAPEAARAAILHEPEREPAPPPFMQFPQYVSPKAGF